MNSQEKSNFPVSSTFVPFLPSPEFLKAQENNTPAEEYVPQPVTKREITKYGYIPTPINNPSDAEELLKKQKQERPPKGNAETQKRKKRRLRQLQKPVNERRSYIHPTSSIAVGDPYWFPVFWRSQKPEETAMFKKTYATLADKQRVVIKTYGDGKITVWRAGEEITLKKANSTRIGTRFN